MAASGSEICLLSFNSRGFGTLRKEFVEYLVSTAVIGNKTPILFLQEHFQLKNNEYKIAQALPGFHLIVKNSVKDTHCNGRPKGGLCIAIPSHLCESVREIKVENWRLQALSITLGAKSLLLVNVYFPVDDRSAHLNPETDETIAALEEIIAAFKV